MKMSLKPGLMQVFGRILSINKVYIFSPNLEKPGFELISAGSSLENQVFSRSRAGLGR
jgi:hypothetical protein